MDFSDASEKITSDTTGDRSGDLLTSSAVLFIISKNIKGNEACNVTAKAPFEFITYDLHLRRTYLSRDGPIATSTVSSPQSAICAPYFKFQYLLVFLRLSSSWLRLVRLPIASIILSIWPSITCFRTQFLREMWPISLGFFSYAGCPFPPWLFVILLQSTHIGSKWSSPAFSCTTFQNFQGVIDLFSLLSKIQPIQSCASIIVLK
jgi:hypothetical protein